MPEHRYAAYLASESARPRRELFRSVQLNAVGWAALAGLCVTGAAVGLVAARSTGVPSWLTAPAGGAAAFAAVLAADRLRRPGVRSPGAGVASATARDGRRS